MPGSVPLALGLDTAGLQVPWYFRCPISLELMRDPVTVSTGQTYDRTSIESWVATGNTTCPVTRAPLPDFTLIPNHTLRRLIQEWCVAHRSLGVERIPTPKQPADPDLIRSLLSQCPALPPLRKLRALARDSDKNRLVMATHETRAALLDMAFGAGEDVEAEAMAVLAMVGLGEVEAVEVVGRRERVARLGELLTTTTTMTLEARVNAGAVVEAAAAVSGADARAVLGAAEGVMEGLVALVEEKANARAVRVGIRGLFALCLAKENRPRAVAAGAAAALARRVEAVRAGAMSQLLLMVQGGCSERAKRKAQHLLKLLRSAWPAADSMANSDDFLQPY
uniref:U-box domain-containing protein n=1 Tax=Oryza punctata TaxID=4537 RepID=A0A0E0K0X7_ORYPU